MSQEGRVTLRVSSAPPDSTPVWVDITTYLHDGGRGSGWTLTTGRQTPLSSAEPARLSLTLDNADHRFTPGNPTSPYFPWWTQGCRVQLQEQIGSWASEYPDFFLELPDVAIDLPDVDQIVTVNAVDRLGRLQSARTFVSTLAEHILYNAGSDLRGLWLLNESDQPLNDHSGLDVGPMPIGTVIRQPGDSGSPLVTFGGADPIPGDDLAGILLTPSVSGGTVVRSAFLQTSTVSIAVNTTTWTFAWWMWWDDTHTGDIFLTVASGPIVSVQVSRITGAWRVDAIASASTVTVNLVTPPKQKWTLCAVRMTLPSGLVEFFQDAQPVQSGTLSGSPPSSVTFTSLGIGSDYAGGLLDVQCYVGSRYTAAVHAAQFQMGFLGLDRQRTGDRVRTIAAYAGVPAGEIDADTGVAVMSPARLAGKDPLTALREAETAEQGRLYCRGSSVVFRDRRKRYDVGS